MKPLLFSILPRPPHPTRDGLAIRNYHLLRCLAEAFRVHAFALRAPHLADGDYPEGVAFEEFPQSNRSFRRASAVLKSLVSGRASAPLLYRSASLERRLEAAVPADKPSWIVAHSYHVGPYALAGEKSWIDFHNLDSEIWRLLGETAFFPPTRWYARLQTPRVRRFEGLLAGSASGLSCVSKPDARSLSELAPGAHPLVVSNGVDLSRYAFGESAAAGETLFFVGDLSWPPNADAVRWLKKEIWPLVKRVRPAARAEILGRDAPADVRSLAAEDFRFLGEGGDTRPHWKSAAVAVVPLLAGGGTRLKILEAAACGVPVVSTSIGAEGLDFEPGREILLADDAAGFASAVEDLLADPGRRQTIARAARARVEASYGWDAIGAVLVAKLKEIAT